MHIRSNRGVERIGDPDAPHAAARELAYEGQDGAPPREPMFPAAGDPEHWVVRGRVAVVVERGTRTDDNGLVCGTRRVSLTHPDDAAPSRHVEVYVDLTWWDESDMGYTAPVWLDHGGRYGGGYAAAGRVQVEDVAWD